MIITKDRKLILFGDDNNTLLQALNSSSGLNIIGICQDDTFNSIELLENIRRISFSELKSVNDAVILVTDSELSERNAKHFSENQLTYCFYKEAELQDTAIPEETPDSDVTEETSSQANPDNETSDEAESPVDPEFSVDSEEKSAAATENTIPTAEQVEMLCEKLNALSDSVATALKNTRTKDGSIYNLNKELQKHKDGYYAQLTQPLAMDIIALREDCKKSAEDMAKYELNADKQKNNLQCTVEQIENLLVVHEVTVENGVYYYNGKAFYPSISSQFTALESSDDNSEQEHNDITQLTRTEPTLESIASHIDELGAYIKSCIDNNEILNQTIASQAAENKKLEKVCDGFIIKPILACLIQLNDFFSKQIKCVDDSENAASGEVYVKAYRYAVDYLEELLLKLGIRIKDNVDNTFDPKHHRMLKMVKLSPDEAEKDKTVAQFCTDCYISDSKVIAPAKVMLYRL